jgi:hypothetical protein
MRMLSMPKQRSSGDFIKQVRKYKYLILVVLVTFMILVGNIVYLTLSIQDKKVNQLKLQAQELNFKLTEQERLKDKPVKEQATNTNGTVDKTSNSETSNIYTPTEYNNAPAGSSINYNYEYQDVEYVQACSQSMVSSYKESMASNRNSSVEKLNNDVSYRNYHYPNQTERERAEYYENQKQYYNKYIVNELEDYNFKLINDWNCEPLENIYLLQ